MSKETAPPNRRGNTEYIVKWAAKDDLLNCQCFIFHFLNSEFALKGGSQFLRATRELILSYNFLIHTIIYRILSNSEVRCSSYRK